MRFQAWHIEVGEGILHNVPSPAGPLHVRTWSGANTVTAGGSAVVLPVAPTRLLWGDCTAVLTAGCYAQVPIGTRVTGGAGLLIETPAYRGLTQIGGPLEDTGRLRYIDGCSDSLLICPARKGDPCLNHLHLPAGIDQTAHTHPSDRIGIILRGRGTCRTPMAAGDVEVTCLEPGMFWYIPAGLVHSFHTAGDALDVLAWHPDSDFGPSHDEHPMINRTIVEGVSAADPRHAAIRTVAV